MKHQRVVLIFLPLIVAVAAAIFIVPGKSQEQKPRPAKTRPKTFEETRFPIAEYLAVEPTDPTERSKRQARGNKYKNSWGIHPDAHSDSVVRVDSVDTSLPALPSEKSSAVIVGQVTEANAYISNDKNSVYSVFTIQVNEVLKKPGNVTLSTASVIDVEREGGRVRFPNGRLRIYMIGDFGMPKVGARYVLFLDDSPTGFELITGYELVEGRVYPLDDLPNSRIYEDSDELTFLSHLRTTLIKSQT